MIEVNALFVGDEFRTEVWVSDMAIRELEDSAPDEFLQKLEYFAKAGFRNFEARKGNPIKHESGGVYRVGLHSSLFRLIGFYEDDRKTCFIAFDAFTKRKKKLSGPERDRIDEVADVRERGSWRKKESNG